MGGGRTTTISSLAARESEGGRVGGCKIPCGDGFLLLLFPFFSFLGLLSLLGLLAFLGLSFLGL